MSEPDGIGWSLSLRRGGFFCLECGPFSPLSLVRLHLSAYTLCSIYTDPVPSFPSSAHVTPPLSPHWSKLLSQARLITVTSSWGSATTIPSQVLAPRCLLKQESHQIGPSAPHPPMAPHLTQRKGGRPHSDPPGTWASLLFLEP